MVCTVRKMTWRTATVVKTKERLGEMLNRQHREGKKEKDDRLRRNLVLSTAYDASHLTGGMWLGLRRPAFIGSPHG